MHERATSWLPRKRPARKMCSWTAEDSVGAGVCPGPELRSAARARSDCSCRHWCHRAGVRCRDQRPGHLLCLCRIPVHGTMREPTENPRGGSHRSRDSGHRVLTAALFAWIPGIGSARIWFSPNGLGRWPTPGGCVPRRPPKAPTPLPAQVVDSSRLDSSRSSKASAARRRALQLRR